jgi:glycosyltransferase involved in cell wall biosynthesis
MESWCMNTPVLVNKGCEVTSYHVTQANGGLSYLNLEEFITCLHFLITNNEASKLLGKQGNTYVRSQYNWEEVTKRLDNALGTIMPATSSQESLLLS